MENVDRRVDALVADLAVEDDFHVSGAFELLENQLVHAAIRLNEGGRHDGERAGFLGVAGGGEEFAGNFQSAGVDAAGHGASTAALGIVERTADAGEGVHEHEDILAHFHQALGALHAELGDAGVGFDVRIVRAGHEFGGGNSAADFGDLFGALVHEQDEELHLRVVFHHGVGDVLQKRRLARAGRGDDQAALAFANG